MNLLKKGKWASYKKYVIEKDETYYKLIEDGKILLRNKILKEIEKKIINKEKKNIKIIVND